MELIERETMSVIFFFNDTATTEIYTLSLRDALPILIVLMSRDLNQHPPAVLLLVPGCHK